MNYYMGVDIGSYGSKGLLIDQYGNVITTASRDHIMEIPEPGYAEHDADSVWWGDFCSISRELIAKSGVGPKQIVGIGCSGIGACCLPVDENNKPLRKAILYGIDVRASKQIEDINRDIGEKNILEKYGCPVTSQSPAPKILWLKENEPECYKKTAKFITSSTFLVAKLTGRYIIDHYTAASYSPMYDPKSHCWDYDNFSRFCGAEQVADCMWTNETAGTVTANASRETGLREGTPVTAGTADAAADAVAAGVLEPGDMLLMFGSSVFMIHVTPKRITDMRYWSGPYLFKDTWAVTSGMSTAGTLTRWFRDELAKDFSAAPQDGKNSAYDLFEESLTDIPAGSGGLIVLPYFSGERTPINDPFAKGVIFGLTLKHTRAHIYQAFLEGVAYGIKQHMDGYAGIGMETKRIVAVGGGAKSQKWMQIVADVTGRELILGDEFGAAHGDALLAALAAGGLGGMDELKKILRFRGKATPDKRHYGLYTEKVAQYTELYEKTKSLMRGG